MCSHSATRERDVPRLEWEKQTEHQANVTPNSSASSKSDVDNVHLFQVMFTIIGQV